MTRPTDKMTELVDRLVRRHAEAAMTRGPDGAHEYKSRAYDTVYRAWIQYLAETGEAGMRDRRRDILGLLEVFANIYVQLGVQTAGGTGADAPGRTAEQTTAQLLQYTAQRADQMLAQVKAGDVNVSEIMFKDGAVSDVTPEETLRRLGLDL